jgi:hypothetical protein
MTDKTKKLDLTDYSTPVTYSNCAGEVPATTPHAPRYIPNSECKQGRCARQTVGCQGECYLRREERERAVTVTYGGVVPAATTASASGELPPLPSTARFMVEGVGNVAVPIYTADQMREYGKACRAAGTGAGAAEDAARWRWFVKNGFFWRGTHCLQTCWPLYGEIGAKDPGVGKEAIVNAAIDAAIALHIKAGQAGKDGGA